MPDRFYRQLENLHIGCEKPRAYFIPFSSGADAGAEREKSERFFLLNGEWDFAYFENVEEIELEKENFTDDIVCPDKIAVPSCWQLYLLSILLTCPTLFRADFTEGNTLFTKKTGKDIISILKAYRHAFIFA